MTSKNQRDLINALTIALVMLSVELTVLNLETNDFLTDSLGLLKFVLWLIAIFFLLKLIRDFSNLRLVFLVLISVLYILGLVMVQDPEWTVNFFLNVLYLVVVGDIFALSVLRALIF